MKYNPFFLYIPGIFRGMCVKAYRVTALAMAFSLMTGGIQEQMSGLFCMIDEMLTTYTPSVIICARN